MSAGSDRALNVPVRPPTAEMISKMLPYCGMNPFSTETASVPPRVSEPRTLI